MNDMDGPHLMDVDPLAGHLQNPGDLTREDRIMLTLWGEELFRFGLGSCLAVYNNQVLAGKMILFFEFRKKIADLVNNIYKESIQQHFENEDQVRDYLGYRQNDDMIQHNLIHLDREYSCRFTRKVSCDLGFGLILDDEEQSTEEYDSAGGERNALDELCC
jgi:hypothetical protein